jgi:uncharacterized membrane protein YbjE (DUF340 family)
MFTVLFFLVAGTCLGIVLQRRKWILKTADSATHWAIYLLLFLLGLSVGANEVVMKSLATLGLQAFLLSSGAVLGSAFAAMGVYRWFWVSSSIQSPVSPTQLSSFYEE